MKKKFLYVLLIILTCFLIYFLKEPISYYKDRYKADKISEEVKNMLEDNNNNSKDVKNDSKNAQKDNFKSIQKRFDSVIAFIYIDDINLSYPIAQAKDNTYYLRKDLYGNYSEIGTIFIDSENKKDFSDKNTIIYGHNMRENYPGGSAFGKLDHYVDRNFLQNSNQIIRIKLPNNKEYHYKIISGRTESKNSNYRTFNPTNNKDFIEEMIKKSKIPFNTQGINIDENSQIITLSTCANSLDDNFRFMIQAIKIKE